MRCFKPWELDYQLNELSRYDDQWKNVVKSNSDPVFVLPVTYKFSNQIVRKTKRLFSDKMVRPINGNILRFRFAKKLTFPIDYVRQRRRPGYVWIPPPDNPALEPVFARTIKELGSLVGFSQGRGSDSLWSGLTAETGTVGLVTSVDKTMDRRRAGETM
jgi:hypothetical protein